MLEEIRSTLQSVTSFQVETVSRGNNQPDGMHLRVETAPDHD